ncbi:MAG: AMP-binding protein, partial [Deltaproteobacteria bacterium]|nr:AMP-binding protein [Deltaproteobacteria bacterium]
MAESIGSMFAERGRVFSQRTALRRRAGTRFEDISYGALLTLVRQFGSGLISLGIKSGDSVFVLSDNRYEWLVADLAIVS